MYSLSRCVKQLFVLAIVHLAAFCHSYDHPAPSNQKPTEKTLLWKLEHHGNVSYLFGTIHTYPKNKWQLPPKVAKALEECEQRCGEISSREFFKERLLGEYIKKETPKKKKLEELIPATEMESFRAKVSKIYSRLPYSTSVSLSTLLEKLNNNPTLKHFNRIVSKEVKRAYKAEHGGDEFITVDDQVLGENYQGLETFEEREIIEPTEFLDEKNEARIYAYRIESCLEDSIAMRKAALEVLFELYQKEDIYYEESWSSEVRTRLASQGFKRKMTEQQHLAAMRARGIDTTTLERPSKPGESSLIQRNKNWIPKMLLMMDQKSTFFAVGMGHLVDLIERLRAQGVVVSPVMQ